MKKTFVLLCFVLISSACSSTVEQANGSNPAVRSNSSAAPSAVNQNGRTTVAAADGDTLAKSQQAFGNSANPNMPTIVKNPENDKNNNYKGRPAPDDSTFNSEMNAKGQLLEVRAFKNHPQLAKVERYIAEKKYTIYLKNGKTIDLAEDKLSNFRVQMPAEILKAAGVQVAQTAPSTAPGEQKSEQKKDN